MPVRPIMNLDEVTFDDIEENGLYTSSRGLFSAQIGAKKLGYNLTVLPPGKAQCPFHCHHGEEEMFLIIEGEGELRFGDERYPIRRHDVIACPTGGPDVAHQIINTGTTTMRYLALSTLADLDACEYPDSQKVSVVTGQRGEPGLRKMFRTENTVEYYDRDALRGSRADQTGCSRRGRGVEVARRSGVVSQRNHLHRRDVQKYREADLRQGCFRQRPVRALQLQPRGQHPARHRYP